MLQILKKNAPTSNIFTLCVNNYSIADNKGRVGIW